MDKAASFLGLWLVVRRCCFRLRWFAAAVLARCLCVAGRARARGCGRASEKRRLAQAAGLPQDMHGARVYCIAVVVCGCRPVALRATAHTDTALHGTRRHCFLKARAAHPASLSFSQRPLCSPHLLMACAPLLRVHGNDDGDDCTSLLVCARSPGWPDLQASIPCCPTGSKGGLASALKVACLGFGWCRLLSARLFERGGVVPACALLNARVRCSPQRSDQHQIGQD